MDLLVDEYVQWMNASSTSLSTGIVPSASRSPPLYVYVHVLPAAKPGISGSTCTAILKFPAPGFTEDLDPSPKYIIFSYGMAMAWLYATMNN